MEKGQTVLIAVALNRFSRDTQTNTYTVIKVTKKYAYLSGDKYRIVLRTKAVETKWPRAGEGVVVGKAWNNTDEYNSYVRRDNVCMQILIAFAELQFRRELPSASYEEMLLVARILGIEIKL